MQAQILAPAAVLIIWTTIMLFWMAFTRLPAAKKAISKIKKPVGARGVDLEGVIPDNVNWKAHNHTHLHEQPTLFYAMVIILAILGASAGDVLVAWIYVGIRIAHSLYQATVNKVPMRFLLFLLGTCAIIWLAVRVAMLTLFA